MSNSSQKTFVLAHLEVRVYNCPGVESRVCVLFGLKEDIEEPL